MAGIESRSTTIIQKGESDLVKQRAWVRTISEGLGISPLESLRRIRRNNSLPLEEIVVLHWPNHFDDGTASFFYESEAEKVLPRFNANIVLLAEASPNFEGPRGLRPSLVTQKNILSISEVPPEKKAYFEDWLRKKHGTIVSCLINLRLTASITERRPFGTDFSEEDVKNGICISQKMDPPTAGAIGVVWGRGAFSNDGRILEVKGSPEKYKDFFEFGVRDVFERAFNFQFNKRVRTEPLLAISYGSKAVGEYFTKKLKFPLNDEQRVISGLTEAIINADEESQDEFLSYFLASTGSFSPTTGAITISDISKPFLGDVSRLINARVTKKGSPVMTHKGTNNLGICTIPSMELYILGYLDKNPELREKAKDYFHNRLGRLAKYYLEKQYDLDAVD